MELSHGLGVNPVIPCTPPLAVTLGGADRERCAFAYAVVRISKSINHVANACDLPVACRPTNEITVRVIHERELSNEQEYPERWVSEGVAAGYHVDGVAILIERDVEYSRDVQRDTFRRIG